MHVIFDHNHVTVRNTQARYCCQQDSLLAYIGRFSILSRRLMPPRVMCVGGACIAIARHLHDGWNRTH